MPTLKKRTGNTNTCKISYLLLSPPAHSPVQSSPVHPLQSITDVWSVMQEGRQDARGWIGLFIWIQYFNPHQVAIFNGLHLKSSVTSEKCTFICTKEKYKFCDCCSIMPEPCIASRHPSCDPYAPIIFQYQQHFEGSFCKIVHSDLAFYRWTWQ